MINKRLIFTAAFAMACTLLTTSVHAEGTIRCKRLWGNGRYETAVEASKEGWEKSKYAIIVSGENFPDAITAGPLAKKYEAPILLTTKDYLPQQVIDELSRLEVQCVYIIGGDGAVSQEVELALKNNNIAVGRLGGENRYETSIKVANEVGNEGKLFVATGEGFADALSISTVASVNKSPIILTPKNNLTNDIKDYISKNKIEKTYVVGGTGVVSEKVFNELPNSERIQGKDRYETNENVINKFKNSLDLRIPYVATGEAFPDALSGAGVANRKKSPIILTAPNVKQSTKNLISNNLISTVERPGVEQPIILGGQAVVSDSTLKELGLNEILFMSDKILPNCDNNNYKVNGNIMLGGKRYSKGYIFENKLKEYTFDLNKNFDVVSGLIGASNGKACKVEVFCDNVSEGVFELKDGDLPINYNIETKGVKELKFVIHNAPELGKIVLANTVVDYDQFKIRKVSDDFAFNSGYLSDVLKPYCGEYYKVNTGIQIGEDVYPNGFQFDNCEKRYSFNLDGRYTILNGILGVSSGNACKIEILCDGESKRLVEFNGTAAKVNLNMNLSGVNKLEFVINEQPQNGNVILANPSIR